MLMHEKTCSNTYSGLQIFGQRYNAHNNVAYIMTFMAEMRFQSNHNVI